MIKKANRVLVWYEANGERLIDEIIIDVPLTILQKIYDVEDSNPMYDCYVIDEKVVVLLSEYWPSNFSFNFNDYSYYFEARAI